MAKRRCCDDEGLESLSTPVSNKITRGLLAPLPVEQPRRPRNEQLLAGLADRTRPANMDAEESHRLFAEELACLNERFVNYCQESVGKDRHCFLFTGFNDYMEHFMGLFATFLAPLTDDSMTWLCFQRLREHCSSKFANVGRYVSQVKDASTCTETTANLRDSPMRDTVDTGNPLERIRSTFDLARRVSSSSSLGASSAGRRRREVMKAMQQLVQVQLEPARAPTTVASFGPILLKNFNFDTVNSALRENVTSLDGRKDQNRRYFQLRREMETATNCSTTSRASTPQESSEIFCSNRVWLCEKCQSANHIDSEICCVCSRRRGTGVESPKTAAPEKSSAPEPVSVAKTSEAGNVDKSFLSFRKTSTPVVLVNGSCEKETDDSNRLKLVTGSAGWDCSVCLVKNTEDKSCCVCCQAPRPASKGSVATRESPASTQPAQSSPPWFCSSCMKVQTESVNRCAHCGTERKTAPTFGTVNFSMPVTNSLATPGAFKLPESSSENVPEEKQASDVEDGAAADDSQAAVTHFEKDAIFAAKCKMYYRMEKTYILKSVGFLNILDDEGRGRKLLFRANNFTGSTMLTARVTPMMKPTIVGSNNVSILTIAYPPFYTDQDVNKPLLVLFKLKSSDDAQKLVQALK